MIHFRQARRARRAMGVTALVAVMAPSVAGSAPPGPEPVTRVSDARLDALRGGLDVNSLLMSIGIARAVFINGEPVVTTVLNHPAVSANLPSAVRAAAARNAGAGATTRPPAPSPGAAGSRGQVASGASSPPSPSSGAGAAGARNSNPVLVVGSGGMRIIQNGPGNTIALRNLPSAGTIIQNTLDNQSIRSVTTIDATVFSRSIMQGLNSAAAMNEALRRPMAR